MLHRTLCLLALLSLPLLSACEDAFGGLPAATGPIAEILVVGDSAMWKGPIGEAIRAELGQPIATLPGNQGAFRLRLMPLTGQFQRGIQETRHVVFAAALDDDTPVAEFIRARLPEAGQQAIRAGTGAGVYTREDVWARGQLVTYVTGRDAETAAREVLRRGPELRAAYAELARRATEREMFRRARQTDEEAALMDKHGWAVNIQHDYVRVQDTTATADGLTGTFVRYRRVLTDTWRDFFVFSAETDNAGLAQDSAALHRITDDLLRQFAVGELDGSHVTQDATRPMRTQTVTLSAFGREATETRGIWRMTQDFMAGPYVRYATYDPETRRLFLYYGMVFAPDRRHDKREFLRQMEVIGHTLRTRAVAERAAQQTDP
ncbi:MAG: DUF4837 family protein [Rubricoccaceae bacterium]